jgi:polar amino acid transport system permease protein
MTIIITVVSFSLGFLISSILTLIRFFAPETLGLLVRAYIDVFRGTPLLVQILLIYFGLPSIGIKLDAVTSAVLAIGLNSGAYQSEIFRTSLKGIPEEQIVLAKALGFSDTQSYRYVILPQAVRNAAPALVNEFVTLLKESSLASVIGVAELTRVGEYMTAATFRALEAYFLIALVYLVLSYITSRVARYIEKISAVPGFERWSAI